MTDLFEVRREPLHPWEIGETVRADANGAVALFVGTTRSPNRGHTVKYLEYEAYEAMVPIEMSRIAAELRAAFGDLNIALVHRLGRVDVGEPSIVVATASIHRRAALDACARGIDLCKERLPIWKREVSVDGAAWVEGSSRAGRVL